MTDLTSSEKAALEDFSKGKLVGQYRTTEDGGAFESAAYSGVEPVNENNGVDVVGDLSNEHLYLVKTEEARPVDATLEGREYLDQVVEYQVQVDVVDRDLEETYDGSREATILSGTPSQTSPEVWTRHAVDVALDEEDLAVIEAEGSSGTGEIEGLMPEDEEPAPTGLDAIDSI